MCDPIDILTLIPDVAAIGQMKLQGYCDEWLKRPIAREYGFVQLNVTRDLVLEALVEECRVKFVGDRALLPFDELLGYIIDQHFRDADQRRQLHAQLRECRKQLIGLGQEYELTAGNVGRYYLKCKNPNCDVFIETSHQGIEGIAVTCPPCEVTCPACGHSAMYDGNDFTLLMKD
jgi:hypothetical protein